jgi:hypothetical protein
MAESFQAGVPAPVTRTTTSLVVGQGGSVAGGEMSQQQKVGKAPGMNTATMDSLLKLGSAVLKPKIEQRQSEEFLKGAQAVEQGRAYKEIIDEAPWYQKIFGPTATMKGAQQMALIKQQDDFVNGVYRDMGSLRELPPDQFGEEVRKRQMNSMTGDATTDAILTTKMVEASGPMYSTQAKEHYKYVQESTYNQTVAMQNAAANKLRSMQGLFADDESMAGELARTQQDIVMNTRPLYGQSAESFNNGVLDSVQVSMAEGDFHYANLMERGGVIEGMSPEQQQKYYKQRRVAESAAKEKVAVLRYGTQIAAMGDPSLTPQQVAAQWMAIENDAKRRFGFQSFVQGKASFTSEIRRAQQHQYSDREKAMDIQRKAQEKFDKKLAIRFDIMQGSGATNDHSLAEQGKELDAVYSEAMMAGDIGLAVTVLTKNAAKGLVAPRVQNDLQAPFRLGETDSGDKLEHIGPAAERAIAMYDALKATDGGEYAIKQYFGPYAKKLAAYKEHLQTSGDPALAWRRANSKDSQYTTTKPSKNFGDKVKQAVKDAGPGGWRDYLPMALVGERAWEPAIEDQLIKMAQPEARALLAAGIVNDEDQAIKVAVKNKLNTVDRVGPIMVERAPNAVPLHNLVRMDPDKANEWFLNQVVEQGMKSGVATQDVEPKNFIANIFGWTPVVWAGRELGAIPDSVGNWWNDRAEFNMPTVVRKDVTDSLGNPAAIIQFSQFNPRTSQIEYFSIDTRTATDPNFGVFPINK